MKPDMNKSNKKPEIISVYAFLKDIPDEAAAVKYFAIRRWKDGVCCPHCASKSVAVVTSGKPMPYRCRTCREHFSVRTGTVLAESKIPLHKWLMAIYMLHTSRKGVSSVLMAKEIGVTQKTAWFLNHRIRKAMKQNGGLLSGRIEADETYIGGAARNMHKIKRKNIGTGGVGKTPIIGVVQRGGDVTATVAENLKNDTLVSNITDKVEKGSFVYTDEHRGYNGLHRLGFYHGRVRHSRLEYVVGDAHTNTIESFWALFKRGYYGVYHWMSRKHLQRYVDEFTNRNNASELGTFDCINQTVSGMLGKRLTYKQLIA